MANISTKPVFPASSARRPAGAVAHFDVSAGGLNRQQIAQALHDGILQDLTAAGLRLSALERSPTAPSRKDLAVLAEWLGARQAALRDFVSELGGRKLNQGDAALALVGAIFEQGTPCHVEIATSAGRLAVTHDGPRLRSDAAPLEALRRSIKALNGRLRVTSRGPTQTLSVTLAADQ